MDNPKVTSKFDRAHGKPRTPGKVQSPGEPAVGGAMSTSHSSIREPGTHKQTHYHPHEHGRMGDGGHADHPTHGTSHPNENSDSGGYEAP